MRHRSLMIVVAVAFAGCAKDVERGPAESRNLAALAALPLPPGAVEVRTETFGRTAPDTSEGPIVGWTTVRKLRLTRTLRAEQVIARARRDLKRAGWRITSGDDFYFNARRKRSCVHYLPSPAPPSETDEIPEFTATDSAPPGSERPPGELIARGLSLIVSEC